MYNRVITFLGLLSLLLIQGCATGAKTGAMVAPLTEDTIITDSSGLFRNLQVNEVTGGKDTNPAWASKVSNENFSEALINSLKLHSMFNESGDYAVNAELKKLKQPILGFDMTVTATANYELKKTNSGEVIFSSEIETPYTAKVSDAIYGAKRLRLANEGAIKENISQFIAELVAYFKK